MCPRKGGERRLGDFVTIADQQVSMMVQKVLCEAPRTWLNQAEEHFLSNLDFLKPVQVRIHLLRGASGHMAELLLVEMSDSSQLIRDVYRLFNCKKKS